MENTVFELEHPVREYFRLALPVVLSMIVTLVYNLADTWFIGSTNNPALVAGVSLCAPVFTLFMAFGNLFGQGGSSLISRYLGMGETEKVRSLSAWCFRSAILGGGLLLGLGFPFSGAVLSFLGTDAGTLEFARSYYLVLLAGAPFILFSFVPSNLLRSEGLALEAMTGTILGAVVNMILDPLFISGLGLQALGAALATVIGYICTDLYFLWVLKNRSQLFSLSWKAARITPAERSQLLSIGFSAALANLTQSFSVIALNQSLLPYGQDSIAAMGIVLKAIMIVQLVLVGFAFGGAPLYGYLYGGGHEERLRRLTRFVLIWMAGLGLGLSLPLVLFSPAVLALFIQVPSIISQGALMLKWQCAGLVLAGPVLFLTVLFQTTGQVVPSYVLALSRQGILFLLVLWILQAALGYTGVLASQALADLISALLALLLFHFRFHYAAAPRPSIQTS